MSTLDDTLRRLLAMPREAGTPAAAEARTIVTEHLRALGYQVTVQRFAFSSAALLAFPLFGAGLGWLALLQTALLMTSRVPEWLPIVVLISGLMATTLLAVVTGLGWIAIGGDQTPREDANLIATRGDQPIRRWIVAHLDTKAQGQSMAGRLVTVWLIVVAIVVMLALSILRLNGSPPVQAVVASAALTLVAGALAGRGKLRGTSTGARDNGTGIAAALAAAEASSDPSLGIIITGAEEFGLVGARIFTQQSQAQLQGAEVVNVDTVDQEGILTLVVHDASGRRLAERLMPQLAPIQVPRRIRSLPLGIFVDSVPFAKAGTPALTIGRLTWKTLRHLHTPSDTQENLSLETPVQLGKVLATAWGSATANEGAS